MLSLKTLLSSKDSRYLTVILVLGILVVFAGQRIRELDAILAARPKSESSEQKKVYSDLEKDPTVIEETITAKPDGTTVTERKTVTGAIKVSRGSETTKEKSQEPVGAATKRRFIGIMVDPLDPKLAPAPRLGLNLWDRFDLAYSKSLYGSWSTGHRFDVAWRF